MRRAPRSLSFWPDSAFLQRGVVYALSFFALAGIAWLTGDNGYLWSATASIWTCLADRHGTAGARMRGLGAVGVGGAVASVLGASLAASPLIALAVVICAGLIAGLAEIRGPAAALCFKLLYVGLIAACLQPVADGAVLVHAWTAGVDYLRGGVFACLISLVLIPSQRDARPRPEIIAAYDALQRFAEHLAAPGLQDTSLYKKEIRLRIEAARGAVTGRRGMLDPVGMLHYAYAVTVADAIFALLIVAGELRERAVDRHGLPLVYAARCLADTQAQVRQALARHAPDLPALSAMLDRDVRRLIGQRANAGAPPAYQSALAALAQHQSFDRWRETFVWPNAGLARVVDRIGHTLADIAARDARVTRHALRMAFAGGLSLLPSQLLQVDHGYWVAVTVIMVLSPRLQTTRQISFHRFAGSLAGALLACLIGLAHPTPMLALGLSAVFLAAAYALRLAGSAGGFAFCLTPAVILFSWLGEPASSSSHVAALRGMDTAIGCLIALASYYVLAPRAELSRAYRHSLDALSVNAVYLRAAISTARSVTPARMRLEALRVAAGRASTRAEDTLAQCVGDLDPRLGAAHAALHVTARRMASLAGLVRAGAESGEVHAVPGAGIQSLLTDLEARLAEVAVRPGRTGVSAAIASARIAPLSPSDAPFEHFLAEQCTYADAHIDSAHRTVAGLRALAAEQAEAGRVRLPGARAG
ncbi:FUSC family protein [Cupriavidus sp.]|uniref:FUSC family protein n=2 Tax=unclassified Cupriavidus TaxID=2640874 RepID=UPI0025BAC764|nr:FUSC family protein [Cupriavidus sp.]MCA3188191.1 FUSC family protein [Cupriavidus sp.]MCA3194425.1 FUSC family protein [Cupriavidus sp.]MCA3199555.1 FUSC family protein [Cupriavidus sp.]MCA3204243.1 FUSC family protein [Cupriavidus sp.]MCA3210524.1 FUSC family protein [Cupriavidus sp.]